ncbi:tRNA CCA-pyrophosphorylase [Pyrococcus sp. NA2]|uniref:CCA tRNA nucleotidyltransferase n=1 Tax=Pyrococcus sp. (strain NA2) TaxID=342949 RepID=UPI000209AC9A|nr:CCA tRNA nucleotidyltransferase [Pyrococcus sp. NA2]AEC51552.1 tRNA CCA-pyrophosphorylase [Pyrococcus sp. NA2]
MMLEEILEKIKPREEERERVQSIIEDLREIAERVIEKSGEEAEVKFVGSIAKDTYLSGDHDIDMFLAFPLSTPLEILKSKGLKIAKSIGERLENHEISYAEHPYVRGTYRGYQVDIVPCYNVRHWKEVRTAVDRSILHTEWVIENLRGRNDEVRLLKRFLKGIGAYGSEIYIRGFSGYLAEILIIKFGSFMKVLEKSDFILRQKIIDPGNWLKKEPEMAMKTIKREVDEDKPLIVIDPVDPRRNVASNLSWERYGLFYFKSQEFLRNPSKEFFFPSAKRGNYLKAIRERKTHLVTLLFKPPDLVDDILLPQIEKSAKGIKKQLELKGFRVLGYDYGRNFIMFEVDRIERENVEIKKGPLYYTNHGQRFYEKNEKVWIEGKDLWSEKNVNGFIVDVLEEIISKGAFSSGKNVRDVIASSNILIDFVPKELRDHAFLFLSREKFRVK